MYYYQGTQADETYLSGYGQRQVQGDLAVEYQLQHLQDHAQPLYATSMYNDMYSMPTMATMPPPEVESRSRIRYPPPRCNPRTNGLTQVAPLPSTSFTAEAFKPQTFSPKPFSPEYYLIAMKGTRFEAAAFRIKALVCLYLPPFDGLDEDAMSDTMHSVLQDIYENNWKPYFTRSLRRSLGQRTWHHLLAHCRVGSGRTRICTGDESDSDGDIGGVPLLTVARKYLNVNTVREVYNNDADYSSLFALLTPAAAGCGNKALMTYLNACLVSISGRSFFQDVVFFDGLQLARGFPLILPLLKKCIGDAELWTQLVLAASETRAIFECMRWTILPKPWYLDMLVPSKATKEDDFFWTTQCRSAAGLTILEHCKQMDAHFVAFDAAAGVKRRPRYSLVYKWLGYGVAGAIRRSC